MIKKILILFLLTLSISIYGSKNWRQVSKANYEPLNDVFFINNNTGWIVGGAGTILKTSDGGYSWQSPSSNLPAIADMRSIYFLNENVGYAGGSNNVLLKSIDGGNSWNQIQFDTTDGNINSIYFSDENTGWILNGKEVLFTNNGGSSWSVQLTDVAVELKSMDFNSFNHGICVGGEKGVFSLYYTDDGLTWNVAPNPTNIPPVYSRTNLYAVAMANDSVACATGWGSSAAGLQPSFTLRTKDGGASWNYEMQAEEDRQYVNMHGMDFLDDMIGIAVGGSSYKGGVAYKTTDSGLTWKEIYFPMGFQGNAICMINNKICVVGSSGGIAISEDAGLTWEVITNVINSTIYDITQLPNGNIIAAGYNGTVLISSDGSLNWKSHFAAVNNICPTIESIFFCDEKIGYAAQRNRTISKTVDGGKNWIQIMKDTLSSSADNYDVQFINENVGFVVGRAAKNISAYYKTTDGGQSWSTQIGNLPNELNSLHFFDESNGVVVGDLSVIFYTEDAGDTWLKSTVNSAPVGDQDYNEVEFLNGTFGLACGDALIKSTDAGKTWEHIAIANFSSTIEDCKIVDELTWYLTGSKFLLKTTDGGLTWEDIIDLEVVTIPTNNAIFVDSLGYPWIAGGNSEIFTLSPKVSVKQINNFQISGFSLEHNYPNPFNPSTKIQYSIPESVHQNVTLKVFDMLGQEVATLVNQLQKKGTYEVEFNATNLSSGVYIYTLKNSSHTFSRKMVLVK